MHTSNIIVASITALLVLALVVYRLLWAGAQAAAGAGLGRVPMLPKRLRNWLFDEHNDTTAERRTSKPGSN